MAYSDSLRDPRWQKKRLEILSRDSFMCKCCGSTTKTLHVHHFKYSKGHQPWEYENENFITFCEDCHADEELFKKFEHDGFVKLNRTTDYPVCRMWRLSIAFSFLHTYHKDEYRLLIDLLNDTLESHVEEWDEFTDKIHG